MGRKGKEQVGYSSNPPENQQRKRRLLRLADQDEEEQQEEEQPRGPKPKWTSGPLHEQPNEWQAELFHDQMNKLTQRKEAFICEKEVHEKDFGPFGVIDKFRTLGWEAALKCYDQEANNLYVEEIQEWMATLKCPPYKGSSKMKLIGTVNGVEVEMSFDTLRRIAKFDSKPVNQYTIPRLEDLYFEPEKHPRWHMMLDYMFLPGTTHGKLYRKNLRIEAKLMLIICTQNVIPRRGDKVEVRYPEVPILYALLNGAPLFPFRFLVLNNIWISRISDQRKIIPHCRLITALLKKYGAIQAEDKGSYKKFKPFDIKQLGIGWKYVESERYHKLKSEGQRWRALKVDARPLRPGEADEPDSEEEAPSGDDDYMDDPYVVPMETDRGGPSGSGSGRREGTQSGYIGSAFDYSQMPYDPNWAHVGTMEQVVERMRPPTFSDWEDSRQVSYDHQTFMGASMERTLKQNYDRQEQWNRAHMFAHEEEINNRYLDDRNRRMHDAWHAGQPVIADPPIVDYSTLPPYDGSVTYPTPPLHHSQWVDPHTGMGSQQADQGGDQGDSSSGSFGFGEFSDMMTSIFGPPQPRYY
ncbi:hypothetical protein L1987_09109 [Smallanthus sonchifolius]|uniref:Uncharacterized protein n=1 Tax=Smallanthus sonchifolius TaxID=185202 RepID=A0ACB9JN26_9ASTR|nr:hypothetical protein L1987_09109 [Smallanthus sonchifolius]